MMMSMTRMFGMNLANLKYASISCSKIKAANASMSHLPYVGYAPIKSEQAGSVPRCGKLEIAN
jgi:hypothetical protein